MQSPVDCLVIGGGPAGLTAAVYLARFRRSVMVIDKGGGRATLIPASHNYPGSVSGISGNELLENLRRQASQYGAELRAGVVTQLDRNGDAFVASVGDERLLARRVLLATGATDKKPALPNMRELVYQGVVRFCPICDGYEATGQRIGIMGPRDHIVKKALFLRTYTSQVTLLITDNVKFSREETAQLQDLGIPLPTEPVADIQVAADHVVAVFASGRHETLDILYPAMGSIVGSGLAIKLGAQHNEDGCLATDRHQETTVRGLYAAGDLTYDLSQISVAVGQAAIAATAIHNSLPHNPF